MRACTLIAGFALGFAVTGGAMAADLPPEPASAGGLYYSGLGVRTGPIIIYDYRPGIVVRAYWLPPWRHRHYFPHGVREPRIGRLEDINAVGRPPEPAESFYRSWSTTSAVVREESPEPERIPEAPLK
jgi:hypothetical protein